MIASFFLFLFALELQASAVFTDYSVTLYNETPAASIDRLIVDVNSGSSSDPHKTYVPLDLSGDTKTQSLYNFISENADVDLPLKSTAVLGIQVSNAGDQDLYIYIASEGTDDTTYYPALSWRSSVNNDEQRGHLVAQNDTLTLWVTLDNLCQASTDCASWSDSTAIPVSSSQKILVFSDTVGTLSSGISDVSTYDDNGFYLDIRATSTVEEDAATPSIANIFRGDTQVVVDVGDNGLATMTDGLYQTVAFRFSAANTSNTEYGVALSGSRQNFADGVPYRLLDPLDDGLLTVNNLTNGESYFLGIAQMNKYYFMSKISVSNSDAVTPAEIEAFLQAKSCFFISAAFKKDHYVLEFFRKVRDEKLLQHPLGIVLVNLYYQLAPEYTEFIWNTTWAQTLIQFIAYTLYYILKFSWVLISVALGIFLTQLIKRVLENKSATRISEE